MFTLWLTLVVQYKPTQHCEAITFRLKAKNKKIKIKTKKKTQNTSVALTAPRIKFRLLSTKNKVLPPQPSLWVCCSNWLNLTDFFLLLLLFWTLRQPSTEVQHKDYSSGQSGLKPWPHLFLAWAWTSYLTALGLHFLICKVEQTIVPTPEGCVYAKHLYLSHMLGCSSSSLCMWFPWPGEVTASLLPPAPLFLLSSSTFKGHLRYHFLSLAPSSGHWLYPCNPMAACSTVIPLCPCLPGTHRGLIKVCGVMEWMDGSSRGRDGSPPVEGVQGLQIFMVHEW